jgi:tetratricopeptide (TPR) repeat protein
VAKRRSRQTIEAKQASRRYLVPAYWQVATSLLLGLIVLCLFVFGSERQFGFIALDDPVYVTANPTVESGLSWQNVRWAFTTGHAPYWHPLTWMSHMLDVQLFGVAPGPAHVVNVMFHVANTLLLFGWLWATTRSRWRSAFAAAIFAVHPLHVESVSWIAERKDVLSGFFWLVTLWAYYWYSAKRTAGRYMLLAVAFVCGLMSKPSMVTLPIVLLLVDIWPLENRASQRGWARWRPLLLEKAPLALLAVATSAVTVLVQSHVGAVSGLATLSISQRLSNAIVGYAIYLWKFFVPIHLAVFYPLREWSAMTVLAAAALFLALSVAAVAARNRRPYIFVGWAWFAITLLPMIGLIQAGSQAVADRFMYLPMIGVLIVVAWGVPDLLSRLELAPARPMLALSASLVVALLAFDARALAASWLNDVTLWRHAVEHTSGNYLAEVNLGSALVNQGDVEGAIPEYRAALDAIGDKWPEQRAAIYADIGFALMRQDDAPAALHEFEAATRLNPSLAEGHTGEGEALAREGRYGDATNQFRAALQHDGSLYDALTGMGGAFLGLNDPRSAIPYYRKAVELMPDAADTHDSLGSALAMAGQNDDAAQEFQTAIRLGPQMPAPYVNFAMLLATEGRVDDARRLLQSALAIDPSSAPARRLLANLPNKVP